MGEGDDGADADVDPADAAILFLPEVVQAVGVIVTHIVADEAGGEVDGDFVAVDADEGHVTEPGAVFDVADFALETAADPGPLGCELFPQGGLTFRCFGRMRSR